MNIREIKFYDCTIDGDFKKNKEGNYSAVLKTTIGDFENNLILLELNKEQYEYISALEYKELKFNVKGHMQIRKNKKEIPFLFFKVSFIMSEEDLKKVQESKKEKFKKMAKEKKKERIRQEIISWKPTVRKLCIEEKVIDPLKIKLLDAEHQKKNNIKIQSSGKKSLEAAVKPIEGTDQYELIFGWKDAMTAKLRGTEIKCYILDKSREELMEIISRKKEFLLHK